MNFNYSPGGFFRPWRPFSFASESDWTGTWRRSRREPCALSLRPVMTSRHRLPQPIWSAIYRRQPQVMTSLWHDIMQHAMLMRYPGCYPRTAVLTPSTEIHSSAFVRVQQSGFKPVKVGQLAQTWMLPCHNHPSNSKSTNLESMWSFYVFLNSILLVGPKFLRTEPGGFCKARVLCTRRPNSAAAARGLVRRSTSAVLTKIQDVSQQFDDINHMDLDIFRLYRSKFEQMSPHIMFVDKIRRHLQIIWICTSLKLVRSTGFLNFWRGLCLFCNLRGYQISNVLCFGGLSAVSMAFLCEASTFEGCFLSHQVDHWEFSFGYSIIVSHCNYKRTSTGSLGWSCPYTSAFFVVVWLWFLVYLLISVVCSLASMLHHH